MIPPDPARSSALRFVVASRSDRSHQKIPVWACVKEIRYERATDVQQGTYDEGADRLGAQAGFISPS